jgi:ketosteroid isomerase-like protein
MAKVKGDDKAAVMKVMREEAAAFWNKDYKAWARCWVHAGYVRHNTPSSNGGVAIIKGWGTISKLIKKLIEENPKPSAMAAKMRLKNVSLRVGSDMAWVTYDQHGVDTGEPDMNMPGVSRETKILEKHDGKWKLVYVGMLPEGGA